MNLSELREEVENCKKCTLYQSRNKLVFGVGSETADIMFVGEAPGYYEDIQGEPFVGAAGQLLDKLLRSIGLTRQDVYIGNVLKCRPPDNRDPLPEEIEACVPFLYKQIEIIKPKIVCTLGNYATRVILGKTVNISAIRGKKTLGRGYYVFPTYHPAAVLRNPNMIATLERDFQEIKRMLQEKVEVPPPQPEQMELF